MSMSREEQLKLLGQMKDSDIDYSDIAATDAEFWQEATVNSPLKVPVTLQLEPSVVAWYIKVWLRVRRDCVVSEFGQDNQFPPD